MNNVLSAFAFSAIAAILGTDHEYAAATASAVAMAYFLTLFAVRWTAAMSHRRRGVIDLEQFARDTIAQVRGNVPDCRVGYAEVQLEKDDVDQLARAMGEPPVDWHPEPCTHADSKWAQQARKVNG